MGSITWVEGIKLAVECVGSIATAIICGLTCYQLYASQRQFNALNAANIIGKIGFYSGKSVLFVVENTGIMPANGVSIKFDDWFEEILDEIGESNPEGSPIGEMIAKMKANRRTIYGRSKLSFLICSSKEKFHEKVKDKSSFRVSFSWVDGTGKAHTNDCDIDLKDEIVLEGYELQSIAESLKEIKCSLEKNKK